MDEYLQFAKKLHSYTGIDLTSYKRPQMERRLTTLRDKRGYSNFDAFYTALRQNDVLLYELLDKMTINVSEFMRNPERWQAFVPLLQSLSQRGPLSAWSAACSTGEEPYTLAMLMEEQVHRPYQILATDIDKSVLQRAEAGHYKPYQVKSVPEQYLRTYFDEDGGAYHIKDRLKQHVTFRAHNLLADPYPESLDVIICRNVLIYFTDEAKQDIVARFARALKPGGILFVGSTEQFLHASEHGLVSVAPFLYQRKE